MPPWVPAFRKHPAMNRRRYLPGRTVGDAVSVEPGLVLLLATQCTQSGQPRTSWGHLKRSGSSAVAKPIADPVNPLPPYHIAGYLHPPSRGANHRTAFPFLARRRVATPGYRPASISPSRLMASRFEMSREPAGVSHQIPAVVKDHIHCTTMGFP